MKPDAAMITSSPAKLKISQALSIIPCAASDFEGPAPPDVHVVGDADAVTVVAAPDSVLVKARLLVFIVTTTVE
jgi:hypothetical protein